MTEEGRYSILLVEDSPMNQRMVTAILKKKGWDVTVAKNGRIALDEIGSHSYDLVLMDVQMPVMDGYEATKEIRKREREDYLPIVAMTAHDSDTIKRECLKVGMDDYLLKPIDVERLYTTVEKYLTKKRGVKREEKEISFVDREDMLRQMGGDEELVREVVEIFTQDVHAVVAEMKEAFAQEDLSSISRLAHGLKGVLGNMGAKKGYALSQDLEIAGRDGCKEEASHLFATLVEHIDTMLDFFSRKE